MAQPYFALLDQDHDPRRRGHYFRQTRQVEDCVYRHRLTRRLNRPRAVGLAPDNAAIASDQNYCAWQVFLLDLSLNFTVDRSKFLRRNVDACSIDSSQTGNGLSYK